MSKYTLEEYLGTRRPFSRQRVIDHVNEWGCFDYVEVSAAGLITVSLHEDLWLEVEDSEIAPRGCGNRFQSYVKYELCSTCGGRGGLDEPSDEGQGLITGRVLMGQGSERLCPDCQGERVHIKVQPVPDWLDQWLIDWQEWNAHFAYEDSYVRSRGG